jgi:hypothetical protein
MPKKRNQIEVLALVLLAVVGVFAVGCGGHLPNVEPSETEEFQLHFQNHWEETVYIYAFRDYENVPWSERELITSFLGSSRGRIPIDDQWLEGDVRLTVCTQPGAGKWGGLVPPGRRCVRSRNALRRNEKGFQTLTIGCPYQDRQPPSDKCIPSVTLR